MRRLLASAIVVGSLIGCSSPTSTESKAEPKTAVVVMSNTGSSCIATFRTRSEFLTTLISNSKDVANVSFGDSIFGKRYELYSGKWSLSRSEAWKADKDTIYCGL